MTIPQKKMKAALYETAVSNNPDYSDLMKAIHVLYAYDLISKEEFDKYVRFDEELAECC